MKRFTFPAVLYSDGEIYMLVMHDMKIATSGATVEEAFQDMIVYLESYLDCALAIEEEIPTATEYSVVAKGKTKNIVLLISAKVASVDEAR